jgi:SAM-dependent methyltransferase
VLETQSTVTSDPVERRDEPADAQETPPRSAERRSWLAMAAAVALGAVVRLTYLFRWALPWDLMGVLDLVHGRLVFGRRVDRLAAALTERLPGNATVLDVGCGDGSVAYAIAQRRPDLSITGVDMLVRPETRIPVIEYDGSTLPFTDRSFDAVFLVDVVHHADDPRRLLAETARVSRDRVLIKDHVADGFLARPTLRLMDWVGNARHGVRLPYNYLTRAEWLGHIERLGATVRSWDTGVSLYPPPLSAVFGRELHVVIDVDTGENERALG